MLLSPSGNLYRARRSGDLIGPDAPGSGDRGAAPGKPRPARPRLPRAGQSLTSAARGREPPPRPARPGACAVRLGAPSPPASPRGRLCAGAAGHGGAGGREGAKARPSGLGASGPIGGPFLSSKPSAPLRYGGPRLACQGSLLLGQLRSGCECGREGQRDAADAAPAPVPRPFWKVLICRGRALSGVRRTTVSRPEVAAAGYRGPIGDREGA